MARRKESGETGKKDVDAYIGAAPKEARGMLRQLRSAIKAVAPNADEKISYAIPYYEYYGRLVYFAAFRHHVSLYVMGRAKKMYAGEIKKYQTSTSTLRFQIGSRIPVALVKRLVRARVKENEENAESKK